MTKREEAEKRDPAKMPFVHLHMHSACSLLEGALRIEELGPLAREMKMPALAITDTANLFGALEFSENLARHGVQPIIGCSLPLAEEDAPPPREARQLPVLVLLVKDEEGYRNLSRLSSLAHERAGTFPLPCITLAEIEAQGAGLICLSGGSRGPLNRCVLDRREAEAGRLLDRLARIFPRRLYLELQRHGSPGEKEVENWLLAAARERGLPVVASNEPYFRERGSFEAHDALLCIAQGARLPDQERRRVTAEHYFKSGAQMADLFADLPEAIANTAEIARRCAFRPAPAEARLPRYLDGGLEEEAKMLREKARAGLAQRLAELGASCAASEDEYRKRLEHELGVIIRMKFPRLFPDRRRFHRLGASERHSGRAGARLRGRVADRLCPADH